MKQMTNKLLLALLFLLGSQLQAQISGTITDSDGNTLIGVAVLEEGTTNGTLTDIDGKYSLDVQSYPVTLIYSYVGYGSQSVTYNAAGSSDITMSTGVGLDEIVVTGSRGKPRTILGSPVPIDNINASDLRASGQQSIDQMLNYKVPSYNSSNQTISDATAHFDPR